MEKKLLPLEERVRKLEQEVERLKKIIDAYIRDPKFPDPLHPDPTRKRKGPFDTGHPDVSPPKEY
ncbi:MAG: hypothetical protein KAS47_07815 [Candidatus Heimdallarchaeota archaeon]|nr:hypothetical protein [Candidatus Heimdallarchaeota archaeon]